MTHSCVHINKRLTRTRARSVVASRLSTMCHNFCTLYHFSKLANAADSVSRERPTTDRSCTADASDDAATDEITTSASDRSSLRLEITSGTSLSIEIARPSRGVYCSVISSR